jgi:hypothetical protein
LKSLTTQQFWNAYHKLPENIQQRARKKYSLFEKDHTYPSLRFKKVQATLMFIPHALHKIIGR